MFLFGIIFKKILLFHLQSTAHQTLDFRLCTALISKALALISNCKCIARRAFDRAVRTSDFLLWTLYCSYFKGISANIKLQVTCYRLYKISCSYFMRTRYYNDRFSAVVRRLAYCPRDCGFYSRTVQTLVCMAMFVCTGSVIFYIIM
jgi:hypothetical protein